MSENDQQPTNGHAANGDVIRVRGARVHNLQNVSLDIPRDQLVVITGPSGSGKSSLAFDTLFAEGQRQYIESLSVYARQFLHQMERPDVDLIEGLQPTVSIDQRAGSRNPRSTVATVTEIYDHLRLLMARTGEVSCYQCGAPIRQQTPEQIVDALLALPEGTKAILMAPIVRGRKGQHAEAFEAIRKAGFVRARVDGEVYDLDAAPKLAPRKNHTIEAVVDRLILRDSVRPRLAESIQLALRHGEGLVAVTYLAPGGDSDRDWQECLYSTEYACPQCKISYEELEPRTFSFNSPYGACPLCEGLGCRTAFDLDLVAPDLRLSLAEGAIAPWRGSSAAGEQRHRRQLAGFVENDQWSTPLEKLKPKELAALFQGDGRDFPGVLALLEQEYQSAKADSARQKLEAFRGEQVCPECQGSAIASGSAQRARGRQGDSRNDRHAGRRRAAILRVARIPGAASRRWRRRLSPKS